MKSMFASMLPHRFSRHSAEPAAHPLERRPRSYWTVTCGIDYFKRYNDIYGRIAGDEALRRITQALALGCGSEEQVFRRGGAEFVIIFEGETYDAARACAEQHRAAVEALQIPHQGSPLGIVTISIGLATIVAGGAEATVEALRNANDALCRAKQVGPNQVAAASGVAWV